MHLTPDSNAVIWWECPRCGNVYKKSVYQRTIKKKGCTVCGGEGTSIGKNNIGVKYPKLVRYWHPYRNTYSPYEIKVGEDCEVWWKCPQFRGKCGHVWKQKISDIIRRFKIGKKGYPNGTHYCPYCCKETSKKVTDEKEEKEVGMNSYISKWLKENRLAFVIEYQGEQHTNFITAWHINKEGFEYQKEKNRPKLQ